MEVYMDDMICEVPELHEDAILNAGRLMPDDATLCELSGFFRVFGDTTRLRILYALSGSELCVCDLAELLGSSQSAVSHQLQLLRSSRLVKYRREGKAVYYSLDDAHVFSILALGTEHIKE